MPAEVILDDKVWVNFLCPGRYFVPARALPRWPTFLRRQVRTRIDRISNGNR